jgi:hypothetical protein
MKKIFLLTTIVLISLLSLVCYRDDLYDNTSSKTLITLSLFQPPRTIYIFTDPVINYPGDFGGPGGRAWADALCQALYTSTFSFLSFLNTPSTVKAFLSVTTLDNIKDLAPGYPTTAAVYGVKSDQTITPIANTWDDLWNTASVPLLNDLQTATNANQSWWSGSDSNGLYDNSLTPIWDNCSNWTSSSPIQDGQVGDQTKTNPEWIERVLNNPRPCSTTRQLMCVAF